jgi:CBS domain-containing protein
MTTAVIALHPRDTVHRAREEMLHASIRHIPIVDESNHVVGIISDRDLVRAHSERTPLGEIMSGDVQTIRPSTPAYEAAATMLELKIGSLPVVNDEEELVGVITETDFLVVAREALQGHPIDQR